MGVEQQDDLYGLPLDQFVPERGALARSLRASGQRDEAAHVAGLKKPSVAAWAVNQLVRTQHRGFAELMAAGDAARAAQAELLAGRGEARALREAVERERAAVGALVEAARGLLSSDGHELSTTTIERVTDTLHAAALEEAARQRVSGGCLVRELKQVGLPDGVPQAKSPQRPREAGRRRSARLAEGQAKRRSARAARPLEAAEKQADRHRSARLAEGEAKRRSERAARALEAAENRRERAARALEEAEEALETAQAEAQDAAEAHRRAKSELDSS